MWSGTPEMILALDKARAVDAAVQRRGAPVPPTGRGLGADWARIVNVLKHKEKTR